MNSPKVSDNFSSKTKYFYDKQEELQNKLKNISNKFDIFQSDKLKTELLNYKSELVSYKNEYFKSNFVSLLSERDYHNRKTELDDLITQSEYLLTKYKKLLNERYGPKFNENDFQEQQFETHEERLMYQKKKLDAQDELIESMIGINRENKQISKEMSNQITKQNSLLDKASVDIDKLNSKINNSTNRIAKFLVKTSYCKLYTIAIIQAIIIIYLIL